MASLTRPAAAIPMAAYSQIAAAVVSPCTSLLGDDQARTQESDTGDDLGRHPRRVDLHGPGVEDVEEPVVADDEDQGGGRTDDRLGPQSGALAVDLAFQPDQPDQRGQPEGDQQLDDLAAALSGSAEQGRAAPPVQPEITLRESLGGTGLCWNRDRPTRVWLSG